MKLNQLIVCDDIRNETGNKFSLMGIYERSIEFFVTPDKKDSWPKIMRIGFYIKLGFEKNEDIRMLKEFKLLMKFDDKEFELGAGLLNIPDEKKPKSMSIFLVHPNIVFDKPGKYFLTFDLYNKSREKIASFSPDDPLEVKEKIIEVL